MCLHRRRKSSCIPVQGELPSVSPPTLPVRAAAGSIRLKRRTGGAAGRPYERQGARATSTGGSSAGLEPVMSKSKKRTAPRGRRGGGRLGVHGAAREGTPAHRPGARALRDAAADRLRADARGGEVGPPGQLPLGGRHRRGSLLPGAATRSSPAALARPGPLRALQGPRRPDPVRGAGPARLLPERGPDEAAQAGRPSPGPPGHDPHARDRGVDRVPGPGPLDERRDRPRAAPGRHHRRPGVRPALRRRLPGGPDVGGRDRSGPLPRHEPDRDRRLQPPSDRRHHRGSDGHR